MMLPPSAYSRLEVMTGGLPQTILISESSVVLDILLRFCYPVNNPLLTKHEVSIIGDVLEAAMKYEICPAAESARATLRECAQQTHVNAAAVYCIACRLKLDEEARAAAVACLKWSFPVPKIPELSIASALDYYHLQEFHRKVSDAIVSIFERSTYEFCMDICAAINPINHSCCHPKITFLPRDMLVGLSDYSWWASSKEILANSFKSAPLDLEKLSLSTFGSILDNIECHNCKNSIFHGWEVTRSAIINYMMKELGKVCTFSLFSE